MSVPESLKSDKSVAPFMARARELADVNPVISYYCRLYVLEYILSNKLHTTSLEVGEFTVGLLDETEAIKNSEDESIRKVLNDKMLLISAVVTFAYKLYNSCLSGLTTYDATKKSATVAKMRAALNFMTLVGMFGDDGGIDFGQLTAGRATTNTEFFKLHNEKVKTLKYQLTRVMRDEVGGASEEDEEELERELKMMSESEKDKEENEEKDEKDESDENELNELNNLNAKETPEPENPKPESDPNPTVFDLPDASSKPPASPSASPSSPQLPGAPHFSPEDDSNLRLPGAPTYLPTDDLSHVNKDSPIHMFTPEDAKNEEEPKSAKPAPKPEKPRAVAKQKAPVTKETINEILDISDHISKIQKHAKFAISALNYDDLATAERELVAGLEMLRAAKAHK